MDIDLTKYDLTCMLHQSVMNLLSSNRQDSYYQHIQCAFHLSNCDRVCKYKTEKKYTLSEKKCLTLVLKM